MVEWKKLGDIASVSNGERPTSDILEVGMYPYINAGRTNSGYLNDFNSKSGAITTPSHGEGGIGCVLFQYHDFWCGALCYKMYTTKGVEGRYLYHYLSNNTEKIINCKNVGGQPYINRKQLENIVIGVPSLSEQQRIVGILDTFTASIDNLKEQIAQRRKQYEYYRDQLLDLEGKEGVEMKMLGEIGKCIAGATPSTKESSYWDNGTIPWMNSGEVHQGIVTHTASFITSKGYNNASTKMLPIGTIVIALAGQGKTRGSVAITAIELCTNQSICGVVLEDSNVINKYVYYYLKTQYNNLRRISSGEGTRGGLNLKMVGSYPIPLPSLQEQQRIVSILDTFEASIQNLEAQLEQRQKQYEYYRNKLLTFE